MAKQNLPQVDPSKFSPAVMDLNKSILRNSRAQNLQQIADNLAQIKLEQNKKKIKDDFLSRVKQGAAKKQSGDLPRPQGFDPSEWASLTTIQQQGYLFETEQQDILSQTRARASQLRKNAIAGIGGIVGRASSRIAQVPSPGDIWFPVAVLIVLNIFLIPITGADGSVMTRFNWFWNALTGNAWLDTDTAIQRVNTATQTGTQTQQLSQSSPSSQMVNQYAITPQATATQLTNYQNLHLSLANQGLSDPTQQQSQVAVPTESYGDRILRLQGM